MTDTGLIRRIHTSGRSGVIAITGGGSLVISDLLCVPGASQTLLEAIVPYSQAALAEFLYAQPEQACSARTARAMAMSAFFRALQWSTHHERNQSDETFGRNIWGIACTASLKSDRPKRGEHRFHLAIQTDRVTRTVSVYLSRDARTRAEEERLAADFLLCAVANASGIEVADPTLLASERADVEQTEGMDDWQDVLLNRMDAVCIGGTPTVELYSEQRVDGLEEPLQETLNEQGQEPVEQASHTTGFIFPGAFNPLHEGHRRMAQLVAARWGQAVEFEISVANVDKPGLDYTEIAKRLAQFEPEDVVWLTGAATFVEKAQIFPAAHFLVGADTILRIADERYYSDSVARDGAIAELGRLDCHFIVFGRQTREGFQTLRDLDLPPSLRTLCIEIGADQFRDDTSSTQLRAANEAI